MYKIYINETPLFLMNEQEAEKRWPGDNQNLVLRYPGKPKFLYHYIDMLEKGKHLSSVTLVHNSVEQLFEDFCTAYKLIEAAGGVVYNEEGKILFIFRRSFWDLPKGKIDKGENPEQAAVREVNEETGISKIDLGRFLLSTYHTYKLDKKRILKKTWWYRMTTTETELIPQTEEDIEVAVWMKWEDFFNEKRVVYGSIKDVLEMVAPQK